MVILLGPFSVHALHISPFPFLVRVLLPSLSFPYPGAIVLLLFPYQGITALFSFHYSSTRAILSFIYIPLTRHYCLSLSLIWAFCPLLLSLSGHYHSFIIIIILVSRDDYHRLFLSTTALLSFPRARLLPYLGIVTPIIWLASLTSEWYIYLCVGV
jgi:hypothetical protein